MKATVENQQSTNFKKELSETNRAIKDIENYQSITNSNITQLANTIYGMDKTIKGYAPVNKTEKTVTHVFFPGILSWLESFYHARILWALLILLIVSILGQTYFYKEQAKFKPGYYKYYGALIYSNNINEFEKYYDENPESFQYKIDSVLDRAKNIKMINSEMRSIEQHYNELDSTLLLLDPEG